MSLSITAPLLALRNGILGSFAISYQALLPGGSEVVVFTPISNVRQYTLVVRIHIPALNTPSPYVAGYSMFLRTSFMYHIRSHVDT